MELVVENEKRKIYREDGKFYTMLNMGDYVGYRNREWYQKPNDAWYLMIYDEIKDDKKIAHMDALVDSSGYYSRLCLEQNGERKIMFLRNEMITEKLVEQLPNSEKNANYSYIPDTEMIKFFLGKNKELQALINDRNHLK